MIPREGRRRRSPETSRRRRKDRRNSREAELQSQQIPAHASPYQEYGQDRSEPEPMLSRVPSSPDSTTSLNSSSSSTSSSLVNISQPPQRFGLGSFFSGSSTPRPEHQAKKQKKKKRSRFLPFGNSSSSSLGSDLAYGRGYIDRRRSSREFSPPSKQRRRRPSPPKRSGTEEEILELGRKFAEIAKDQQTFDKHRGAHNGHHVRGIRSPRALRDSSDDSEWESASDDESSSEDNDSGLAYGSVPSSLEKPVNARSPALSRTEAAHDASVRHKRSLVDPKLFGPVNSLHGHVHTPCGFERVDRDTVSNPQQPYEPSIAPSETLPAEGRPLQQLYPIPTSDPSQFDAGRGSVVSVQQDFTRRSRPRPVPLQQPKPIVPVSKKVFESVDTDPEYSKKSSVASSIARGAVAGIAGAAFSAMLKTDRKEEDTKYEEHRGRESRPRSKQSSVRDFDERDEKRTSRDVQLHDDRLENRRERDLESDHDYKKEKPRREKSILEAGRERERENQHHEDIDPSRDRGRFTVERKDDQQSARQEDSRERREEKRTNRSSDENIDKHPVEPDHRLAADPIDPFQYQVADDAFHTPRYTTPKRSPTPNVVTVDREPDFSRFKFPNDAPSERLSRKDSYEREHQDARDATVEKPSTEKPTTPVAEAALVAVAAAAALMTEDRRGRRRGRGGDSSSRHRSRHSDSPHRSRDRVQDDADRYWREEMLARRIRGEARRSRSNSPDSSVVDKWNEAVSEKRKKREDSEIFEVVQPSKTGHPKKKSPYDGPDADVRVDNVFQHPSQLPRFELPNDRGASSSATGFSARDPSAERERPVLNIIRPTPAPTPMPEDRKSKDYFTPERSAEGKKTKADVPEPATDIALGPRGEVIVTAPTPAPASEPVSAPVLAPASATARELTIEPTQEPAPVLAPAEPEAADPDSRTVDRGTDAAPEKVKKHKKNRKSWALESPLESPEEKKGNRRSWALGSPLESPRDEYFNSVTRGLTSEEAPASAPAAVPAPVPATLPVSASKAVSWGENQTKHYVVESPERGDDPDSGAKVIIPAETPKPQSRKKSNAWRTIANVVSMSTAGAAGSGTSKPTTDADETQQVQSEDREESSKGRSSLQYDDTDDSPPVPGPKPTGQRSTQMPGAFVEDPSFTASIAAGLEGSGFDPNIVIDDAYFHRRDSRIGSNEPIEPSLGGEASRDGQEPEPTPEPVPEPALEPASEPAAEPTPEPIPNDPPKAPVEKAEKTEKNGLSIHNSAILLKLVEKLKRKQQAKSKAKKGKNTTIEDSSSSQQPASSRSSVDRSSIDRSSVDRSSIDHSSIERSSLERSSLERSSVERPSVELSSIEEERSTISSATEIPSKQRSQPEFQLVDTESDDKWENASPKKRAKKLMKKAIVIQKEQQQAKEAESSNASVSADTSQDVKSTNTTRTESKWDFLKLGKTSKNLFSPNLNLAAVPDAKIFAAMASEVPEDERNLAGTSDKVEQSSEALEPPTRPALNSELSRESSYRIVDADSTSIPEDEQSTPKSKKPRSGPKYSEPPPRLGLDSETSAESRRALNDEIVSIPDDERNSLKPSKKDRRNSIATDSPVSSEVSVNTAWRHTIDEYPSASSVVTGDGWDFLRRSKKVLQHESGAWGSPAYPRPTAEDVVESPKETTGSFFDMRSEKSAATVERDTPKLNQSNGDSTPYEDFSSPTASRFEESLGILGGSGSSRWDRHIGSLSSTGRPRRRRSLPSVFADENHTPADEAPPDIRRDSSGFFDNEPNSPVSDSTFYTGHISSHISTRSRGRGDDLDDDADSIASAPAQDEYDNHNPRVFDRNKRSVRNLTFFDRVRSSIGISEKERSSVRKSEEDKKNSFLANAGTLGAGAGLADTAIAVASQESDSKATDDPSEKEAPSVPITPERRLGSPHLIDPEIVEREIRPAIDPQYGDLLPLPPTTPGTPAPEIGDEIPPLPESRPGTPESDRERLLLSGKSSHVRRRSDNATRARTPSQSAIPIHFRLKSTPTSPGTVKSTLPSPTTSPEHESPSRTRARPISWDKTKAFKPLLLVERASQELMEASSHSPEEFPRSRGLIDEVSLQALEAREDTNSSGNMPTSSSEPVQPSGFGPSVSQVKPENEELADMSKADTTPTSAADDFHEISAIPTHGESTDTGNTPIATTYQSADLPHVEVQQADDSELSDAMENLTSSPLLPPWELSGPVDSLSPIPEPVDSTSKDRSSDLFHSSPSTHKFSDFDISEGGPNSEPAQEGTETGSITEHVPVDDTSDTSILVAAAATSTVTGELIASSVNHEQGQSEKFSKKEDIDSIERKGVPASTMDPEAKADPSSTVDNQGAHEDSSKASAIEEYNSTSAEKSKEVEEELSDIDDEIDTTSSTGPQAPRDTPLGPRGIWSGALPWAGAVSMLRGVPRWTIGTPRRESLQAETAVPTSPNEENDDQEKLQTSGPDFHDNLAEAPAPSSPTLDAHHEQFFDAAADETPFVEEDEVVEASNPALEEVKPEAELKADEPDSSTVSQGTDSSPKKSDEQPDFATQGPTVREASAEKVDQTAVEQTSSPTEQKDTESYMPITEPATSILEKTSDDEMMPAGETKLTDVAIPLVEPTQLVRQQPLEEHGTDMAQEHFMGAQSPAQDQPGPSAPQESVGVEASSVEAAVVTKPSKRKKKKKKGKKTETQEASAGHGDEATDVLQPTADQHDSSQTREEPSVQSMHDNKASSQLVASAPSSPSVREGVSPEDTMDRNEAELQQTGIEGDELATENRPVESSTDIIMAGKDAAPTSTESTAGDNHDALPQNIPTLPPSPAQEALVADDQFDPKVESESGLGGQLLNSDILNQDNRVVESTVLGKSEAKDDMAVVQAAPAIEASLQGDSRCQASEWQSLEQADVEEQPLQPNTGGEPQTKLHAARSGPHGDPPTETAPAENLHDNAPPHVEAVDNLLTSQTTTDELAPTLPHPSTTEDPDAGDIVTEEPAIEQPNAERAVAEHPATTGKPVIEVPTIEISFFDEPAVQESAVDETLTEGPVTEEPITDSPIIATAAPEKHVVGESVGVESREGVELPAEQVPPIATRSTHEPLPGSPNATEQSVDAPIVSDTAEMIAQIPTEPVVNDVWFEPIGSSKKAKESKNNLQSQAIIPDDEVEPANLVEEAKPVEEPNPVEPTEPDPEVEGSKPADVTDLKSTEEEELKPIEKPTLVEEGQSPVGESKTVERPKLVEELTLVDNPILVESPTIVKEPKLAEEPTLVEEPQPTEERKLVEELTLVEEATLPSEQSHDIQSSNEVSHDPTQNPPPEQLLQHPVGEDLPPEPISPGKKSKKKKKKGKNRQNSDTLSLGEAESGKSVDEPAAVENDGAVDEREMSVNLPPVVETNPSSTNQPTEEPSNSDIMPNKMDSKELESPLSDPIVADIHATNEAPIITGLPVSADMPATGDSSITAETPIIGDSQSAHAASSISAATITTEPVASDTPVTVASDAPVTSNSPVTGTVPATQTTIATEEALVGTEDAMANESAIAGEMLMTGEAFITDDSPISGIASVPGEAPVTDDTPAMNQPSQEVSGSSVEEGLNLEEPALETSMGSNEVRGIEDEDKTEVTLPTPSHERQAPSEEDNPTLSPDVNTEAMSQPSGMSQEVSRDKDEELASSFASPDNDKSEGNQDKHQSIDSAETLESPSAAEPMEQSGFQIQNQPDETNVADQVIPTPQAEDQIIEDESQAKQASTSEIELDENHETSETRPLDEAVIPDDAAIRQSVSSIIAPVEDIEAGIFASEGVETPSAKAELDQEATDTLETHPSEQITATGKNTENEESPGSLPEQDVMAKEDADNDRGNETSEVEPPTLSAEISTDEQDSVAETRDFAPTSADQVASELASSSQALALEARDATDTPVQSTNDAPEAIDSAQDNTDATSLPASDPVSGLQPTSEVNDDAVNTVTIESEKVKEDKQSGQVEEPLVPEPQPTQDNDEIPAVVVSDGGGTDTPIALENSKDQDSSSTSGKDNEKQNEAEMELEPPNQLGPHTSAQVAVESTAFERPGFTSHASSENLQSAEGDTLAEQTRQLQSSASDEVPPLCAPDNVPFTGEGLSTDHPVDAVEQETVREPSPTTDALNVEPVDVEEVTTTPMSSEPIVSSIPQQAISSSPMENEGEDGTMPSEETHVTPSGEQQDALLPKQPDATQSDEQPQAKTDVVLPEGHDVPLPEETELDELAEQAEVTREVFDEVLLQSPEPTPAKPEEPPHQLSEQIHLAKEPKDDSRPDQGSNSEVAVQVDDLLAQPLQSDAAPTEEPHQELQDNSVVGESGQASQPVGPAEDPSQATSGKKSKKKKKRKSQAQQLEPEAQHQSESTTSLQDTQEPQPSHEKSLVPEKEPGLQPIAESASTIVQDEATPENAVPTESPKKKSKKKKKRASQVELEAEPGNGTSSESQVQPPLPEDSLAKQSPIEGISTGPTEESSPREISTDKHLAEAPLVQETPVQAFPLQEIPADRIPGEFPLEEPKQDIIGPGKPEEEATSDILKDTEQVPEPMPEHSRLRDHAEAAQDLQDDRQATDATSQQNTDVNKQVSLTTSQPEDITEGIPTERINEVSISDEIPQGQADDSPEFPTTLSKKDENEESNAEAKPKPPIDAQTSPLQDGNFSSVTIRSIAHEAEGVGAPDNQWPEYSETDSTGKAEEHTDTQIQQRGQPVAQMPAGTALAEATTEGRKESKKEGPVGGEIATDVSDATGSAPREGLSSSPEEGQDENQKSVDNESPDEETIDYSTLRQNWERKTRNEQPLSQTPRKNVLDDLDIESPVVARETIRKLFESRRPLQVSPTRREPEISEIMQNLDSLDTSEEQNASSTSREVHQPGISVPTTPNFGRHSPGNLAPVEEETREELEKESPSRPPGITRRFTDGRTGSRDSGVAMDALYPLRLSLFGEMPKRDSGVHVRDEPESTDAKQEEGASGIDDIGTGLPSESKDEVTRVATPKHDETSQEPIASDNNKIAEPSTPVRHKPSTQDEGKEKEKDKDKPSENANEEEVKSTSELHVKKTRGAKSTDVGTGEAAATTPRQDQRSASEKITREANASPLSLSGKQPRRSASNTSISRLRTPEPLTFRPEGSGSYARTNTPPLMRRSKRMSGDLRSLSQPTTSDPNLPGSKELSDRRDLDNTTPPIANEGRVRAKDMTDVYDGYGEGRIGSPRSPTKPHSMRRRHSMQVLELEARVEQLITENQALAHARHQAEQSLTQRTTSALTERDAEIEGLKASLQWLRNEVTRLTEVNEGLHSANNVLAHQHTEKYSHLERQHASAAQELEEFRGSRGQYTKTLQDKDAEIQDLRAQLEAAKEQVREMQKQILASKPPDAEFLRLRDEDHFDHRCQQLCSHVQQWVLRFSKFSDMRASRLTSEINDEKIIDRLDNSVLDGSEVDSYLRDRVKRRDVFMSMTMNMIWEFVFTRYLFGMDREQRQKLKSVEKLLTEVGPPQAVRQWRAVTLTLLSKRPAFGDQRNQDTEAVVQAILRTLSMILPPPSNMEAQIQSQLRRVMREAVDLSIEMRTQRAEYVMLPPLQPEYDANGDLTQTVAFNTALMNERSGDSVSNEELEAQGAIVRCVLFPLVVKKGDDNGVGDDEIVVCPAQVLVSRPRSRTVTPTSDKGSARHSSRNPTPSTMGPTSMVSVNMPDATRSVAGSTWSVD